MNCKKCKKEHDGSFGSGKYCSRSCANSRQHSNETKLKIGIGVKTSEKFIKNNVIGKRKKYGERKQYLYQCQSCKMNFFTYRKNAIYCSSKCVNKDSLMKQKLSKLKIQLYKLYPEKHPNRRCAGMNESYPERSCREYFELNGLKKDIDFIQHYDGIKPYFIDFYIPKLKLGIEIDGERWHDRNNKKEILRENIIKQQIDLVRFWSQDIVKKKHQEYLDKIINTVVV